MSERVANAEIEDVLLSIRRLVQGDTGEAASSPDSTETGATLFGAAPVEAAAEEQTDDDDQQDAAEEPAPAADALVLTAALRVDDEDIFQDAAQQDDDQPDVDDIPTGTVDDPDAPATHETPEARFHFDPISEVIADDAEPEDDLPEVEATDAVPGLPWAKPDLESRSRDAESMDVAELEDDDDGLDVPSFVRAVAGDLRRSQEERAANAKRSEEAEAAATSHDETAGPELSEEVAAEDEEPAEESAPSLRSAPRAGFRFGTDQDASVKNLVSLYGGSEDDRFLQPEPRAESDPSDEPDAGQTETEDTSRLDDPESLAVDELLTSIVKTFDTMDASDADKDAAPTESDRAIEEAAELDEPVAHTPHDADDAEDPGSEDQYERAVVSLDKDVLAELVAECLHKELQGELGERITRNVRKLVRREIHRALSMRDFD